MRRMASWWGSLDGLFGNATFTGCFKQTLDKFVRFVKCLHIEIGDSKEFSPVGISRSVIKACQCMPGQQSEHSSSVFHFAFV